METQTRMDDAAPIAEKRMTLIDWDSKRARGAILTEEESKALNASDLWAALKNSDLCLWRDTNGKLFVHGENSSDPDMWTYISMADESYTRLLAAERAGNMETVEAIIDAAVEEEAKEDQEGGMFLVQDNGVLVRSPE
jgi:hypothetical protein